MEKFFIGKIVKAQGIKGEVKIKSECGDLSFLKNLKSLYVGSNLVTVKSARVSDGFAYVLFSTIADRNQAEEIVGLNVYADKNSVPLDEDSYFVDDMLLSEVVLDDGREIGVVEDIIQNGKCAEIYRVKTKEGYVLFPFLKDLVLDFDREQKRLLLCTKRFGEVSLYED